MRKYRNYWLAWYLCLATTILTIIATGFKHIEWLILSDINVALFLLIAWLFDNNDQIN